MITFQAIFHISTGILGILGTRHVGRVGSETDRFLKVGGLIDDDIFLLAGCEHGGSGCD